MAPTESRIPLAQHALFALSMAKSAEAGRAEAATALLQLIAQTTAFLHDLAARKLTFPKPLSTVWPLLEELCAKMTRLWQAADRLPTVLPQMTWLHREAPSEKAAHRIRRIEGSIRYCLSEFAKAGQGVTFFNVGFKEEEIWGLLDDMERTVKTAYAVELAAQPGSHMEPDCSDLKERWLKTLRPGRGKLKFADQERRRIFDHLVDRFRKAGRPVPTIRKTCELVGGSKTTIHMYWEEARNRLRY